MAYPFAAAEVLTAVDLNAMIGAPTQNAITTVTYTAVLLDAGKTVTLSNASAVTLNIPAQATVSWADNTQLNFLNLGAGTVTITPAATVTINGTPLTLTTSKGGSLVRTASNTWTFRPTGGGKVVQIVNVQTGALATGTTPIPADDTIPQITEGDQYMTLAITPTNASNILTITVTVFYANNTSGYGTVALFVGSTANALAGMVDYLGAFFPVTVTFSHRQLAGVTTALTFRVRAGLGVAGTTTFNGINAGRILGGVAASSITIEESTP